jgi:catechol 2,3-dioxygenase-like lactoylglutathione lyase family enzyme
MDVQAVNQMHRPKGMPFRCNKIGHVALYVKDLERSAKFYTEVMGFSISDAYDGSAVPGGAVFLRVSADHHGVALFRLPDGQAPHGAFHHMAFEVSSLDEVVRARDYLRQYDVPIHFQGRRRAGCQIAIEFTDPDGHNLEIYWNIDQVGSDGKVRPPAEWKGATSLEAAIADPVVGQDTTLQDRSLLAS